MIEATSENKEKIIMGRGHTEGIEGLKRRELHRCVHFNSVQLLSRV